MDGCEGPIHCVSNPEQAADAKKYPPRYQAWKAVEEVYVTVLPHMFGCVITLFSFFVPVGEGGA